MRENPQNSETQNGPRSRLDFIALTKTNPHHNRDSNSTSEQYQPHCAIFLASRMFLTKGNQKPRK